MLLVALTDGHRLVQGASRVKTEHIRVVIDLATFDAAVVGKELGPQLERVVVKDLARRRNEVNFGEAKVGRDVQRGAQEHLESGKRRTVEVRYLKRRLRVL